MEAPNKIYATVQGSQLLGCSTNPYRYCEEFIRKNFLLEWAKKKQYESTTIVADNFWQEVIDKLEAL